jgi:hypothetical protein
MAFADFMADPKGYLRTHQIFIGNSLNAGGSVTAQAQVVNASGGFSREFRRAGANITMTAANGQQSSTMGNAVRTIGIAPVVRRDFTIAPSATDVGFRFLPYRQGEVTYMALDAMAQFFITGPLTGCTVAMGRRGGRLYTFHSFAPVGVHGPAARTAQTNMVNTIGATLGAGNMLFAENTIAYNGQGFVFGRARGSAWKFYAYGSASGVHKIGEL